MGMVSQSGKAHSIQISPPQQVPTAASLRPYLVEGLMAVRMWACATSWVNWSMDENPVVVKASVQGKVTTWR